MVYINSPHGCLCVPYEVGAMVRISMDVRGKSKDVACMNMYEGSR